MTKTEAAKATGDAGAMPQGAAVAPAPAKATTQAKPEEGRAQIRPGRQARRHKDGPGHQTSEARREVQPA